MNAPATQSDALKDLLRRIRAGDPSAIAPETYGLDKILAHESPHVVLELVGTTFEELSQFFDPPVDMTPQPGETFGAWAIRTDANTALQNGPVDFSEIAYAKIGYDWVDWKWLAPGQTPKTLSAAAAQPLPQARSEGVSSAKAR